MRIAQGSKTNTDKALRFLLGLWVNLCENNRNYGTFHI